MDAELTATSWAAIEVDDVLYYVENGRQTKVRGDEKLRRDRG